jgi:hypothetical protein
MSLSICKNGLLTVKGQRLQGAWEGRDEQAEHRFLGKGRYTALYHGTIMVGGCHCTIPYYIRTASTRRNKKNLWENTLKFQQ